MSPQLLTYESKFNGVYSRNNSPKVKDGAYVINLDESKSIGTHWIALFVNGNNIIYFDSFEVEYISKEIKFIVNKNLMINIYGTQAYDSNDDMIELMNEYDSYNVWILLYWTY